MRNYLWIFFLLLVSCRSEYKKCEIQTNDIYLKAYNDILNEIIAEGSYNGYLGKDENRIFEKYQKNMADSDAIKKEIIYLHNNLYNDTSKFCTLYFDSSLRPQFISWVDFQKDSSAYGTKIKNLINSFPDSGQVVIDSMNSVQKKYLPIDFRLCVAAIKPVKELEKDKPKCYIGKLVLSKLLLNKGKDKGILYYEFTCGGLCGYGRIIIIEIYNGNWYIKEGVTTWIS